MPPPSGAGAAGWTPPGAPDRPARRRARADPPRRAGYAPGSSSIRSRPRLAGPLAQPHARNAALTADVDGRWRGSAGRPSGRAQDFSLDVSSNFAVIRAAIVAPV